MSAAMFTASLGAVRVAWEVVKTASKVVFDEDAPLGQRIAYGVGGVCAIGATAYIACRFIPEKSD